MSPEPGRLLDGLTGYRSDFPHHDENLLMLDRYVRRLEAGLEARQSRKVVSLGIGHRVVAQRLLDLVGRGLDRYWIVEGSAARISELRDAVGPLLDRAVVVHSLFEDFRAEEPLDAVEMGFVLEHVDDPEGLLRRYRGFLGAGGFLGIAVPNARSLHRLVGHAAGLLDDVHRLSEHDLALGHRRYYDLASLRRLVEGCGLHVVAAEGLFLKCLTTGQLAGLQLDRRVLEAFCSVAAAYPEIANAVYLEASL